MHKNWFEQCELVSTSSPIQLEPVWSSSCMDNLHWLHCTFTKPGLSSLNWFSQPAWMSPWTSSCTTSKNWFEQCEPVWSNLPSMFEPVWWQSTAMEIDAQSTLHAQKLVLAIWTSFPSKFEPVLNQFGPVWTSFNCFLWQSTLHCSCTTNKNWFEQCELVWTSTHSQFEPVWSS